MLKPPIVSNAESTSPVQAMASGNLPSQSNVTDHQTPAVSPLAAISSGVRKTPGSDPATQAKMVNSPQKTNTITAQRINQPQPNPVKKVGGMTLGSTKKTSTKPTIAGTSSLKTSPGQRTSLIQHPVKPGDEEEEEDFDDFDHDFLNEMLGEDNEHGEWDMSHQAPVATYPPKPRSKTFDIHPDYTSAAKFQRMGHIPADSAFLVTQPHFQAMKEHLLGHTHEILQRHQQAEEANAYNQEKHALIQKKIEKNPNSPHIAEWKSKQNEFAQGIEAWRQTIPKHVYTAPDGVVEEIRKHHWQDLHQKISECRNFKDLRALAQHPDSAKHENWFRETTKQFQHSASEPLQHMDKEGLDRGNHTWRQPSVGDVHELESKYHLGGIMFHHDMEEGDVSQVAHMLSNGLDDLKDAMGIGHAHSTEGYNVFGKHMRHALRIQVMDKGGFDGTGARALFFPPYGAPSNAYGMDAAHPRPEEYTYPAIRIGSHLPGSLAHEFGHAIDMMGEHIEDPLHRQQYQEQVNKIKEMVGASPVGKQTEDADKWIVNHPDPDFSHKKLIRNGRYYSDPKERFARAFEQHIHHKLQQQGKTNSFLTKAHYATDKEHAVYLKENELHPFHDEFDKLFDLIKNSPELQKALFGWLY